MLRLVYLLGEINKLKTNDRMEYSLTIDDDGNIHLITVANFNIEQNQPMGNISDLEFAYSKMFRKLELLKTIGYKNKDGSNKAALFGKDE
jgi:hypothetical protein